MVGSGTIRLESKPDQLGTTHGITKDSLTPLVSFPGAYDSYDFNEFKIWNSPASLYKPPGPAVFDFGGGSNRRDGMNRVIKR